MSAVDVQVNANSAVVSNGGTTAPAGGTSESWTVIEAAAWPAIGTGDTEQFRIMDKNDLNKTTGYEIMIVTARASSSSWTVTRGAESTTPYAHSAGWTAVPVMSAGGAGNTYDPAGAAASALIASTQVLPGKTSSFPSYNSYVNVNDLGARYGMSATVNTNAVIAAIALLSAAETYGPKELYFPDAEYNLNFGQIVQTVGGIRWKGNPLSGRNNSGYSQPMGGTLLIWHGNGVAIQNGTDNGEAWDGDYYDGPENQEFSNLWFKDALDGTGVTLLDNVTNESYIPGNIAIQDWRGGGIHGTDLRFWNFDYWFWGIQSDYDVWERVQPALCHGTAYLGPRSDQMTFYDYQPWGCDFAFIADGCWRPTFYSPSIVECGAPQINGSWSRQTVGVKLIEPWFEWTPPSDFVTTLDHFITIGGGNVTPPDLTGGGTSGASSPGTYPALNTTIFEPLVLIGGTPDTVNYLAEIDNADVTEIIRPQGPAARSWAHNLVNVNNAYSGRTTLDLDFNYQSWTTAPAATFGSGATPQVVRTPRYAGLPVGYGMAGDIILNEAAGTTGVAGWFCSVPGYPATWIPFGNDLSAETHVTTTPVDLAPGMVTIADVGSEDFYLPEGLIQGQTYCIQGGTLTATNLGIHPNTGQTINGSASTISITTASNHPFLIVIRAVSTTAAVIISTVGTDAGAQLVVNSNLIAEAELFGNGTWRSHHNSVTAAYTTLYTDFWVRATSGTFTVTLGSASFGPDQLQAVTNEGTGVITLAASGGAVDLTTLPPSSGAILQYDGTNWHTVGSWGTLPPIFTAFSAVATSPAAMAAGTLYTANTGAATFNLPATIVVGQMFGVQRGTSTATLTITANTGQTINGGSSGGSITLTGTDAIAQQGFVWLMATSTTTYQIVAVVGTDAGLGLDVGGSLIVNGGFLAAGALGFLTRFVGHAVSKTSAYSTVNTDWWVRCTSGTFTVTLASSAMSPDQEIRVTNEGTGVVTLSPNAGTIDGVASRVLTGTSAPCGITVLYDGTNWHTTGAWGAVS